MKNICSELAAKISIFLNLFSPIIFGCLLFGLIGVTVDHVQAQNASESKLPKRESQRKNPKQAMLEQMAMRDGYEKTDLFRFGAAAPSSIDPSFNPSIISDNAVIETIVPQSDGKILIGGSFTSYNGTARSNIARLNADGTVDETFGASANETVRAIYVQPNGKILIGGSFTEVNSTPRSYAARLNADGTLDATFDFRGANAAIYDLKSQADGKVIIGGDFTFIANVTRNRVARLNVDGSLDPSFDPGTGPDNSVYGLDLQADGKVMIVGLFDRVTGVRRRNAARLNSDGTFDPEFDFGGVNFFGGVGFDVLIQPDGKILLAGFFQSFSVRIVLLARVNPDGTTDPNFDLLYGDFLDDYIEDVDLLPDGKVVIGGYFFTGSQPFTRRVARLNSNGTLDTSFHPGTSTNSSVEAVAAQPDGKILIGGFFTSYQGATQNRLARLTTTGSVDTAFNTGSGVNKSEPGRIYDILTQSDGKILIGGAFQQVNGVSRKNIARLNADGSLDTTFNPGNGTEFLPGYFSPVYTMSITPSNQIIIGGSFSRYNNQFADNIARINSNGSLDTNFLAFTYDPVWKVLVQPNGETLVGGQFIYFNDFLVGHVIRIDNFGELDYDFNEDSNGNSLSGANSNVLDITLQSDGKIIIAGEFQTYNNIPRNRIARLNQNGSLDTTFVPGSNANASIWSTVLQTDGKILLGDSFIASDSTPRGEIDRLNTNGSLDNSFDPSAGANQTIYDIYPLSNGKILVGGAFTRLNNTARVSLARLNSDGTLDSSFASQTDGIVRKISSAADNKVLIGGFFSSVNGVSRMSIARLDPHAVSAQPNIPYDFDGDRKADVGIFRPSNGEWWINQSSNGLLALQFGNSADRIVSGDYTGDGKSDVAFWRPSIGQWFVLRSENLTFYAFPLGTSGDIPVPADYDGDGKTDAAVFRPSSATWYIQKSSGGTTIQAFGQDGDRPAIADFDGDGKADLAIFRPASGQWWINRSSTSTTYALQFGESTDQIVPADFTGDGKADLALFRPSNGTWYVFRSDDNSFYAFPFGAAGDVAAPADYDGDGKADPAIFRSGTWYIQRSTSGLLIQQFGAPNDNPIPMSIYR